MVATATLPVYFAFARPLSLPLLVFGVVMAAFVVYTHRSNIEADARWRREPRAPALAAATAMIAGPRCCWPARRRLAAFGRGTRR